MKKILYAALAALVLCAAPAVAQVAPATGRTEVYSGQNPDTNESNIQWRFQRLTAGTLMRDILGQLAVSGAWSNLAITAASGLYVTVNPSTTSQLGAVYQMVSDDSTAIPPPPGASPYQLPPDNTKIIAQGTQNALSGTLGPLTAPGGGGNANYYVIEAQLSQVDTANQSILFVSSSGITSYQNVNTERADVITYQVGNTVSTGTANCTSTFPTTPGTDSGWVTIGYVCVPHGTSQITSGLIAMAGGTNFNGYSFGSVSFGGAYAQNGGATPSTLTTHNFITCGLTDALGVAIDNASPNNPNTAGHEFAVSQAGVAGVCGATLYIFNNGSNSTAPQIEVDTPVDSGTATNETLYPASGNVSETLSGGACSTVGVCATLSGGKTICANAGSVNAAAIAVYDTTHPTQSQYIGVSQVWANPGVTIQPTLNTSGQTIANSDTIAFHYVCF